MPQYLENQPTLITAWIGFPTIHFQPEKSSSPSCTELKCCSNPEILAKEIDYLHKVPLRNKYPDWIIKKLEKKPTTPYSKSQHWFTSQ